MTVVVVVVSDSVLLRACHGWWLVVVVGGWWWWSLVRVVEVAVTFFWFEHATKSSALFLTLPVATVLVDIIFRL